MQSDLISFASLAPAYPELLLAVGVVVLLLAGVIFSKDRSTGIAFLSIILLVAVTAVAIWQPAEGVLFNGGFIVDGFARYMKFLVLGGSAFALVLSTSTAKPMGLDKFEVEMKSAGLADRLLAKFGRVGVASTLMRFVGAYQEDVEGAASPAELVVRGKIPEIDPGTAKAGDKTEWSTKMTCTYVKWTVSGRVLVEIDWLNCIYIVDGEDRYAEIRAAMGL